MRVSVQAHAKVHLILGAMSLWTRVQGPNYYPRRRHRRHNAASTSALLVQPQNMSTSLSMN